MDSIKDLITVLCAHLPAENQNPQSFYAFIEDRLASFEDILFSYIAYIVLGRKCVERRGKRRGEENEENKTYRHPADRDFCLRIPLA